METAIKRNRMSETAKILRDQTKLQQIQMIIECPICSDEYSRPTVLPCVHTFCLKCLKRYTSGKSSGDEAPCPICRQEFTIPPGGLGELPKNFIVESVIDTIRGRATAAPQEIQRCFICFDEDTDVPATDYCTQCRQKLCKDCGEDHKRCFELHRVIPLGVQATNKVIKKRDFDNFCSKHKKDELVYYCFGCWQTVCKVCREEHHKHHDCPRIAEVFEEIIDQMEFEIQELRDFIIGSNEFYACLEREKERFINSLAEVQRQVTHKSKELKALVDCHASQIMFEVGSLRERTLLKISTSQEDIKMHTTTVESFTKCYQKMKDMSSPHDLACRLKELHDHSTQLLTSPVIASAVQMQKELGDVEFLAEQVDNLLTAEKRNLLGRLKITNFDSSETPPVNASCAGPKAPPVERQVSRNLSLWEKRAAAAQQDEDDEGSTSLRKHYSCLNIFGYSLCIALVVMWSVIVCLVWNLYVTIKETDIEWKILGDLQTIEAKYPNQSAKLWTTLQTTLVPIIHAATDKNQPQLYPSVLLLLAVGRSSQLASTCIARELAVTINQAFRVFRPDEISEEEFRLYNYNFRGVEDKTSYVKYMLPATFQSGSRASLVVDVDSIGLTPSIIRYITDTSKNVILVLTKYVDVDEGYNENVIYAEQWESWREGFRRETGEPFPGVTGIVAVHPEPPDVLTYKECTLSLNDHKAGI